jgi:hypothetical protein
LRSCPVILEGVVDVEAQRLSSQDELWYVPVELDTAISYGHIKQYRIPNVVYDADPAWVTEIRYHKGLNVCWKRFVCCKELMHVFDSNEERADSSVKFCKLLSELETPLEFEKSSEMYKSETKAMWMALAILCPAPLYHSRHPVWIEKNYSNYAIALDLRIPEQYIDALKSENFRELLSSLEDACRPE